MLGAFAAYGMLAAPAALADPSGAECAGADARSAELRREGKLLEARAELATCSAASCPADVHDACARRTAELGAAIPTVTLEAQSGGAVDLAAVVLTLDGQPLPARLDKMNGVEIELDPGDHVLTVGVPGEASREVRFALREAEKRREPLDLAPPAKPAPPAAPPTLPTAGGTVVQFYSPSERWASGRWSVVDKDHKLVCKFPCAYPVTQDSGLEIRRIPIEYGHDDEFYPLPKTFDVPPGQRGRITVTQARLLGTYGRYGSIFPILVGLPATVAGLYIAGSVTSLTTASDAELTRGGAEALAVGLTTLGVLLLGGGITWLVLARDPQVSIVPEGSAR